jgi:Uma2 family endonuclease
MKSEPATATMTGRVRILLEDVSWKAYEALLETWADRPVRLTYDRGRLEIMPPMLRHEGPGGLLRQMVELYTLVLKIPRKNGGSTTFRREAEQRGLEPDGCYWIQNEPAMCGKEDWDSESDPPPDLAIEVDITHSSLDRMGIYASLGIPEVWRFDSETLTFNLLQGGEYVLGTRSRALPGLPPAELARFLDRRTEEGEIALMSSFQAWVRKQARARGVRRSRRPPKK